MILGTIVRLVGLLVVIIGAGMLIRAGSQGDPAGAAIGAVLCLAGSYFGLGLHKGSK